MKPRTSFRGSCLRLALRSAVSGQAAGTMDWRVTPKKDDGVITLLIFIIAS